MSIDTKHEKKNDEVAVNVASVEINKIVQKYNMARNWKILQRGVCKGSLTANTELNFCSVSNNVLYID